MTCVIDLLTHVTKWNEQYTIQNEVITSETRCPGTRALIVQIHEANTAVNADAIFPGDAGVFVRFDVQNGLDALRSLIPKLVEHQQGLVLVGNIGITSHFGDLLRSARVPSRIERSAA